MPYDPDSEKIVYLTREKLVKLLAEEETEALLKKYGGTRVRVPREGTPPFDEMADLIGEISTRALSSAHTRPPQTRTGIVALAARGLTRSAIAHKLGLTERHVRRVISEAKRGA